METPCRNPASLIRFFWGFKKLVLLPKKNDCVSATTAKKSFLMEVQLFFLFRPHEESVVSISQALSGSQAQLPHQQQQHQPMVFTTTASVIDEPDNNMQLFHSTKFWRRRLTLFCSVPNILLMIMIYAVHIIIYNVDSDYYRMSIVKIKFRIIDQGT